MRILVDTNVIIDVLNKRKDFFDDSFKALQRVFKDFQPCITTQTVTDTIYITRKIYKNSFEQKKLLEIFFTSFKILAVSKKQIKQAFNSVMTDFEDSVQAFCAKRAGCKLILTRNVQDFVNSPVKSVTPTEFLHVEN